MSRHGYREKIRSISLPDFGLIVFALKKLNFGLEKLGMKWHFSKKKVMVHFFGVHVRYATLQ